MSEAKSYAVWQVANEVARLTREQGNPAPLELAAVHTISLFRSRQEDRLEEREELLEEDKLELAQEVVNRLQTEDDPALEASKLRMQFLRLQAEEEEEENSRREKREIALFETRNEALSKKVEARSAREKEQADESVESLLQCASISNGFDLSDVKVRQEATAALQSVLPHHLLVKFHEQSKTEKKQQVQELESLIQGIRIFNHHRGTGGYGLEDLSHEARVRGHEYTQRLNEREAEIRDIIVKYRQVIDWRGTTRPPDDPVILRLRDEMLFYVHLSFMVEELSQAVQRLFWSIDSMHSELVEHASQALSASSGGRGVLKSKVYPLLDSMARQYNQVQVEARALIAKGSLVDLLCKREVPFSPTRKRRDEQLAQGSQWHPLEVGEAPRVTAQERPVPGVELASGSVIRRLALEGFDPVLLGGRWGVPVQASRLARQVEWNERAYGFATEENSSRFAAAPEYWEELALRALMSEPSLALLVPMEEKGGLDGMKLVTMAKAANDKVDCATQTPTHFIESNLDHSYEWNEWALRRKALQLVNLKGKATRSAQSELCHFRRDNEAQVWLPKDAAVNTTSNKGTTMPRKQRYMQNLRGDPAKRLNVVRLDIEP